MPLSPPDRSRGLLGRMIRDVRANTLAMMAIALIPLTAMAGSAIDMGRMYMVKVRLQQACDAGVLAGRKFMADSAVPTLDANATLQAKNFFKNNFRPNVGGVTGWMQTSAVNFTPTKTADNQVSGTATATVPMSVMKMFAVPDQQLNVVCEARFDVADTDVMFVLDTTGSMACPADNNCNTDNAATYTKADGTVGYYIVESANSKIAALRKAVLNFYDTMDSNTDPSTHIRYGFVTYSANVNVGRAIPDGYLIKDSYDYQSRKVIGDSNSGGVSTTTYTNVTSAQCIAFRNPASGYTTAGTANVYTFQSYSGTTCKLNNQKVVPLWQYGPVTFDVSGFVTGAQVADKSKVTGANSQQWLGCIEEKTSAPGATSFDINNLPSELDPDLVPSSKDQMWAPAWPDVIYRRSSAAIATSAGDNGGYPNMGSTSFLSSNPNAVPCGKPAKRLSPMTRNEVDAYVNGDDFRAIGNTYHDIGMVWGTRLISPTGLWKDDTAAWPGRNAPNRHLIFMTDGDMATVLNGYGLYGTEQVDRRITGTANTNQQENMHNARFVAECQAARARGIEVWVIAFGQSLTTQLKSCAKDSSHIFYAKDDAALDAAFKKIAEQVAMLRLSK